MSMLHLRTLRPNDRAAVAELICVSTNRWLEIRNRGPIFPRGPESTAVFFDVYEALDPGCGVVAEEPGTGRLMGSCFYHPREHHVSLGIMNVHPDFFGRGVARDLLTYILDYADQHGYAAVRLTQSAMNLDSFSLYTRAGFVPRAAFQDMLVHVPQGGPAERAPGMDRVRPARMDDVPAMAALEMEVSGICREKDYRHLIANREGFWNALVQEGAMGGLEGFLLSCTHPAMCMLGPGVARNQDAAAAMILRALDDYRGGAAVVLVPVDCAALVARMYGLGARNCDLHFCQVRGAFQGFRGISFPTFLPETG